MEKTWFRMKTGTDNLYIIVMVYGWERNKCKK